MLYRAVSLGTVDFSGHVWEHQLSWQDPAAWQPVGQTKRRALAGNLHVTENSRSGRPIVLIAEHPYCWLRYATVAALETLASTPGAALTLTLRPDDGGADLVKTVAFDRAQGPLKLAPRDAHGDRYTGSIYLIEAD